VLEPQEIKELPDLQDQLAYKETKAQLGLKVLLVLQVQELPERLAHKVT
jgi:hypothetical protein